MINEGHDSEAYAAPWGGRGAWTWSHARPASRVAATLNRRLALRWRGTRAAL